MILILLGLLVIVVAAIYGKSNQPYSKLINPLRYLGIVLVLIGISTACFVEVGTGQVGVKSLFGKVDNTVLNSGLNFVNPLMNVTMMDVKTQNYTMSSIHDEGDKQGDDAIRVLTADGLEVTMDISVIFRVQSANAPILLKEVGVDYIDKVVRPVSRTKIRDNAVYYQAVDLFSTKREEFQSRIAKTIEADFKTRGLILEQILVRNITLPASVRTSIEEKISAEQDAQKMQFVLQKEKQEAERKRVEAQGIADYQHIISMGLTDKQLQYEQIKAQKEIATSPNTKIIFMGKGGAPVILDAK